MKRAITISTASSCSEGGGTSCDSGDSDHIFSGTDTGAVSGSCSVDVCASGDSSGSFDAVGTCTNYIETAGITINGDMDVEGSWSNDGNSGSVDIETKDGQVTFAAGTCSLVVNIGGDWTATTLTVTGCACLCDECFSVSCTETI